ncbi:unnamed protein product [Ectocarpus sp. 4 AP-2014]
MYTRTLAMPCASLQNDSTTKQKTIVPGTTPNEQRMSERSQDNSALDDGGKKDRRDCYLLPFDSRHNTLNKTPSEPRAVSFCRYTPTRQQQQTPFPPPSSHTATGTLHLDGCLQATGGAGILLSPPPRQKDAPHGAPRSTSGPDTYLPYPASFRPSVSQKQNKTKQK